MHEHVMSPETRDGDMWISWCLLCHYTEARLVKVDDDAS